MQRERFHISTIDPQAHILAAKHGFGLEIAEYCTAWNMDAYFEETDRLVRGKLEGIPRRVLHGPFNELFPCAIDPRARELARERYRQALTLAKRYGASKVVLHGGYNPWIYHPVWYTEQSILFWKEFLGEIPEEITICLENVMEEKPGMLVNILEGVGDPRLRMCLDVGHVNAYSKILALEWLEDCAPYIGHFHIHNNSGEADTHRGLTEGTLPMARVLREAERLCPEATFTLEVGEAEQSVLWLLETIFTEEYIWKQN